MSKYTTELRFICENAAGLKESEGYNNVGAIIQKSIPSVFNFEFPIFDETYRNVICTKILKHYYTREISEETVGLWKLRLDTRLNEIMPYYNQLYKSELLEFNPLYDTDLTTRHNAQKDETTKKSEEESENRTGSNEYTKSVADDATTVNATKTSDSENGTTTNNDTRKELYSDTPQGSLQNVENETYLTNARKIIDSKSETRANTSNGESSTNTSYKDSLTDTGDSSFKEDRGVTRNGNVQLNSTDEYVNAVSGKSGGSSYSKMLEEFRKTFLNIDMMVIEELSDLFFGLW